MNNYPQILTDIETHNVKGIQQYFENGGDPNEMLEGLPLFTTMVEMYSRGPEFRLCIQAFIDAGLQFEEEALLMVLTDNSSRLENLLKTDTELVRKTYSLFRNAYTSLQGGTLMHYCSEYNSVHCARLLFSYGADINAKAAIDESGFGGQTPIFHTVNQNGNHSADMLHFLLENNADLTLTVKGLIWGKGYEWETFVPAVNPISYAMMGLLPQFHRKVKVISEVVSLLMKQAFGIDYTAPNGPNAYLVKGQFS